MKDEFSWEREERLEKNKEKRDIKLLKSQGWKVSKNDFDIMMVKHPEHGMMTLERALKGDYDDQAN